MRTMAFLFVGLLLAACGDEKRGMTCSTGFRDAYKRVERADKATFAAIGFSDEAKAREKTAYQEMVSACDALESGFPNDSCKTGRFDFINDVSTDDHRLRCNFARDRLESLKKR